MECTHNRPTAPRGTTLVELTVATALMAAVFAATLPLFVGIRNSTEARWAGLEMVQNARVLNDQLCRYLTQARRIVAVGTSAEDRGYLEFEAQDGVVYRCGVGGRDYVEFGPVGRQDRRSVSDGTAGRLGILAGPVEYLRFACYDDTDFDRPVGSLDEVRLVTWEARLQSSGPLTPDRTVVGACCLRSDY